MRGLLAALLLLSAGEAAAEEVRFVTCPVYRDTDAGRKSGCWLADDPATAARYDVTPAPAKPDWNRAVLIEGKVSARQDGACGGITLDPVRASILDQPCTRHMLEPEGFKGRAFVLPKRNIDPLSVARTPPPPPYADRLFRIYFSLNSDFIMYQYSDYLIDQMVTWLRAARPKRIIITGYAATGAALVSGQKIAETPAIAKARADMVAEALSRLGFPRAMMTISTRLRAEPADDPDADGLLEPSRRRVEVRVEL